MARANSTDVAALARELGAGRMADPFSVLGPHVENGRSVVRTFQPGAARVELVDDRGGRPIEARRVGESDLFCAELPPDGDRYHLRLQYLSGWIDREDPYRFPSQLGDLDLHLIGEGTHYDLYRKLGAHLTEVDGVRGVQFAVWAPNALRVSVVGDFNDWDGRRHVMRFHPAVGVWDIFVPAVTIGSVYKYEVVDRAGEVLPLKADPFAAHSEPAPGNASLVFNSSYRWEDKDWMETRPHSFGFDRPVAIYEVHLGSWRRRPEDHNRRLSYRELADELVSYLCEMGFTHVELMPVSEHPFDGSWGYQPTGLFAPTSRFGNPDDFRFFVDRCHGAGIGVVLDWVGAHFPRDSHGLGRFDGSCLYEHEDPRRGVHSDWDTLIFNYGRNEVCNYLLSNALYWIRSFHIDALRIDAVASMIYLDYSRKDGQWLPNQHGGNENLEAIAFLRRLNEMVHAEGGITIAEESTAWPGVSRPVYAGGLGFSYKWNMGWMNDTLSYVSEDPVHRKHHHDRMTFGLVYAFDENFVLPLSHDEVVHGKRSILGRMPGDEWQRFANVRAYFGFMFAHPGKKLLFMGNEFAQNAEWNHDDSLDWHLLDDARHSGVQRAVADLNRIYRATPALYELDTEGPGFRWIDWNDRDNSVFSWIRYGRNGDWLVCVTNFTPVVRHDYLIGVPAPVPHLEVFNSDAVEYGGSGCGNEGRSAKVSDLSHCGLPASLQVTIPPLASIYLVPSFT